MNEPENQKNKQLALFGLIVAEVVVNPCAVGGLVYWLTRGKDFQMAGTVIGAFFGLGVGFYRVYLMQKRMSGNEQSPK